MHVLTPFPHATTSLSILLANISPGSATFTTQVPSAATSYEVERLYRALAEFAMEAAVQSVLLPAQRFRVLAFKLTSLRASDPLPQGLVEGTAELVTRGPQVLRAVSRPGC